MIKFHVHQGTDEQWYVRISSGNNEPWFTSEGYTRESDAVRSIDDLVAGILASIVLNGPYFEQARDNMTLRHEIVVER